MSAPNAWGLTYQDVVSLCWLAYGGQGKVGNWQFPGGGTWNLTTIIEPLNFRAVVVTSPSGKKILSFSGTDGGMSPDWLDNISQGLTGLSWQYAFAAGVALAHNPDIVVGHSLGGGLASYVAIHQGRKAATINPAPLHLLGFNGGNIIGRVLFSDKVVNYVVRGEALDLLDILPNMDRPGAIHYVPSNGTNPVQKHLLNNLTGFTAPTYQSAMGNIVGRYGP
jgi:hypothetical protein